MQETAYVVPTLEERFPIIEELNNLGAQIDSAQVMSILPDKEGREVIVVYNNRVATIWNRDTGELLYTYDQKKFRCPLCTEL